MTSFSSLMAAILFGCFQRCNAAAPARLLGIILLPVAGTVGEAHLYRGHLVLGAVGGPARLVGRDDVRLRLGMVECGVDHALGVPLGIARTQRRFARATAPASRFVVVSSPTFGISRGVYGG